MSPESQSVVFNSLPLLALALAYAAGAAVFTRDSWRSGERKPSRLLVPAALLGAALAALAEGLLVLRDRRPLAGHLWVSFAALLVALAPALVALLLRSARMGRPTSRVPEEPGARRQQLEQVAMISSALASTLDDQAVARLLLDEVGALFSVDFAGLALVDADGRTARGFLARAGRADLAWWSELVLDLENEPSGIASAAFEATPFTVYDVAESAKVSKRLVEATGALSAAYVPLVADGRVTAVMAVATTAEHRAFGGEELSLMQALAGEAGLALERARSAGVLADALRRERLMATISRKVRSELDLDAVLRVAVSETGKALGLTRCLIQRAVPTGEAPVVAQWAAADGDPAVAGRALAVSNLALREGRTVAIADLERAPELDELSLEKRGLPLEPGSHSVLVTPIEAFGRVHGVFALHRSGPRAWSPDDVRLAEAIAREVGLAQHVAGSLVENERRVATQGALLRAAQVLTRELRLESVLQLLVTQLTELLDVDAADCYLVDEQRGTLRCAAVHGFPPELIGYEFAAGKGVAAEALRSGRPVIAVEYAGFPDQVPHPAYRGFTGAMVAPMRWGGTARGVLGVGTVGARVFGPDDVELLDGFAGLAALAIANAEAFEQSARQARVQRGFYRIASVLSESLAGAATLEAVAQAASESLGGDFAAVLMPGIRDLELAAGHQLPAALGEALAGGVPESARCLELAAAEQRVLAAPAARDDNRFEPGFARLAEAAGFHSLLAIPVGVPRIEACGLVVVFFAERRVFSDEDLDLARHLAEATRAALERSELFEAERTSRALSEQLARTGSLLATELDPEAVLGEVVRQAPALVGADAGVIRELDGDQLVVSEAAGTLPEVLGSRLPLTARLSGDVVQSRGPVALENVADNPHLREVDPLLAAGQHDAYLGVPLTGPEGVLHGVLCVYARRPRRWRAEEIEALQALAGNTSAALSNAELYQRVTIEKDRGDAILANIADGIVAVDREGAVVLWNAAAERITGVPADEALGRTPFQSLQRRLESEGETPAGDRLVSIPRGGDEVWLSLTEAVMHDPAGAVAGRIFAFRDISSDRLLEQMKTEFVATVSHELRTPLTSIYGFAETLLRKDVDFSDVERATFLGYIASESERLTVIVDALLNVARLDAGDLQVKLAPTDVRSVVSEVVDTIGTSGASNGHRFVVDLPEEPLSAEADPDKLRQVFSILVENAVKYSPDGGTVTVGARLGADVVEVSVLDQGVGIPTAEQERIFRKFYRADATGRPGPARGGTGLGLFIARGLVAAMGGRMWVTSTEGEGSNFSFELPLARA